MADRKNNHGRIRIIAVQEAHPKEEKQERAVLSEIQPHPVLRLAMPAEGQFFHQERSAAMKEAIRRVIAGAKAFQEVIFLPSGIDPRKVMAVLRVESPELFMIEAGYRYIFNETDSRIYPTYNCTREEAEITQEMINKGVAKIVRNAKRRDSVVERLKYVYDWFALNQEYGYVDYNKQQSYSAAGVFRENKAVCAGFAQAFQLICKRLGIDSGYVVGNIDKQQEITHAWNIVRIDGCIYHVDVTTAVSQYSHHHILGYPCFLQTTEEVRRWRYIAGSYPQADNPSGTYLASIGCRFDTQADLERIILRFNASKNSSISVQAGAAYDSNDKIQQVMGKVISRLCPGGTYLLYGTGVCVVSKKQPDKPLQTKVVRYH